METIISGKSEVKESDSCRCAIDCKIVPSVLKVGLIGGSGLENANVLDNQRVVRMTTPFGPHSDAIIEGELHGVKVYVLPRHGRKHNINPTNVNYRANMWALRELGCTHVIVSNACGSLREHIEPGHFVVPSDIIDRTHGRKCTFYDGSEKGPRGVLHMPMCPAFSEDVRQVLIEAAETIGAPVHKKGVIVVVDGPRYSTQIESRMFQSWGGDIIGMTTMPEAILAKEAGMLYASLAMATDYDSWRDDTKKVSTEDVKKTFQQNVDKVREIFILAIKKLSERPWIEPVVEARRLVLDNFLSKP